MYKVLRILNRFNLGGPSYNAAYLTKYINKDFTTKLVGGPPRKDEASSFFIFEELGVNYTLLQEMSPYVSIKSELQTFLRLSKIIEEFTPEIVHTHASRAGLIGRFTASLKKVPIIVHTFHGHHFSGYTSPTKIKIYKQIERYLSKISSAIIAISDKQKEELVNIHKVVPEEKCYVIPLGFDLSRFTEIPEEKKQSFIEEFHIPTDKIIISIIGRFAPIKNHLLLVESVALLPKSFQEKIRILVVGDGDLRETILKEINKKGLSAGRDGKNLFVFTSWIKDVSKVLGVSDIVVLTSLNEGTPVSLIEAQAAGVPVISTNVGGVSDVVTHNETGLLVPSNSPEELARALRILIEDPEKRKAFGEAGKQKMLAKYSYQRLVKDVENLYYHLLENKGLL